MRLRSIGHAEESIMLTGEDRAYYQQRVIIERHRATLAPNAAIANVHMKLADLYEEELERDPQWPHLAYSDSERRSSPWRCR